MYRGHPIGGGGAPLSDDPTLALLRKWADELRECTEVVFLGDNVYPAGVQPSNPNAGDVLLQQLRATRAAKLFVPGNHDWGYSRRQWLVPGVLAKEQAFIESHAEMAADFLPKNGCPGPSEVELLTPEESLTGGLTLVALDLHWWLLDEQDRPACEGIADTSVPETLRRCARVARAWKRLVVAHHPIRSGGPHGGQSRGFWLDLGVTIARPLLTTSRGSARSAT